jgi:hypothetical protein
MRRLRCTGGGAAVLSTNRQCNAARLAHPYRLCRGWRQIDLPAAHKGAAIIDAYGDTPVMTDLNKGAERQRAMRRRHCHAIQPFTVRGA